MNVYHRFGSVTIRVIGVNPELFFQECIHHHIRIRNVYKIKENVVQAEIAQFQLRRLQSLIESSNYEIVIIEQKGYIPALINYWQRKEIMLATIISILFLFFVSQIIWNVTIEGVSEETEHKLRESLFTHGIYKGGWIRSLAPLHVVEEDLITNFPSLEHIGIERKGTYFYVKAVEKREITDKIEHSTQDLIAEKSGVIKKMFIRKGIPVVQIDDVVERGDLLVSGTFDYEEKKDEEADNKREFISAEGEVYATTWYEIKVTSPLMFTKTKNLGTIRKKYFVQIGDKRLPLTFWKQQKKNEIMYEISYDDIRIFTWHVPIQLIKQMYYEANDRAHIRTVEEAKEIALEHVLSELRIKLGKDAEITNYYILHQSVENGKVNLYLYVSVIENIAKGRLISS